VTYNRITAHHTGGGYRPTADDLRAYHISIDGEGQRHKGVHPLDANAAGKALTTGAYYPHTWKLNSGNFGISVCSMVKGDWNNPRATAAYPRAVQIDAMIEEIALRCREFSIQPSRTHTLSHAEVEPTLGVKQKNKWDFDYQIRTVAVREPVSIFDEIRQEVSKQLGVTPLAPAPTAPAARPTIRQGATGEHVVALQKALGLAADGAFGPKTRAAVVALQRRKQLLPDGAVGKMTWLVLGL
jgi:hypothetical protein